MTKSTQWILGLVGALVIIVIISLISDKKTSETITIGATLPLTGQLSFIGEQELHGLTMAIDDLNSDPKRKVQLVLNVEDNQGDAKNAVSAVQKLVSVNGSDIIVSSFTHIVTAISDLVTSQNVPLYYQSSAKEVAEKNPLAMKDYFDATESGQLVATYLNSIDSEKSLKLGYLGEQNDACTEYKNGITSGGRSFVITEEFQAGTTDFKTILTKIKGAKIDRLVMCTWRSNAALVPQINDLGMIESVPMVQTLAGFLPAGDTPELRALYERNKTVTVTYDILSTNKKEVAEFSKRYEATYKTSPRPDAFYMYEGIMMIADAFDTCVNDDLQKQSTCVVNHITSKSHNGLLDTITFSKDRVSNRKMQLAKVIGGEWIKI